MGGAAGISGTWLNRRRRAGIEERIFAAGRRPAYNQPVPSDKPLDRLRALCLALPETSERLSHGEPAWFVRGKKAFVTYADHHHDDRLAFWCAAPEGAHDVLVRAFPLRFFVPPYVGGRGWLGVYLDVEVDWPEVAAIIGDAYRVVAPRSLVRLLDAGNVQAGDETHRGSTN